MLYFLFVVRFFVPFDDAKLRWFSTHSNFFLVFLLKLFGQQSRFWPNRGKTSKIWPKQVKIGRKRLFVIVLTLGVHGEPAFLYTFLLREKLANAPEG